MAKEYIEREALIQQMADNFRQGVFEGCDCGEYQIAETTILCAPTADVVEVVRCRDCKYLYCLSAVDRRFYCRHSPHGLTGINIVEDNPFCSYGERNENDS